MDQYSDFYNQAKQAGFNDQQIQGYLQAKGFVTQPPAPVATPPPTDNSGGGLKNTIADLLPTIGAVGGGALGSLTDIVDGPLGTVGGAAGGASLGETLKELIKGDKLSPGSIATQGALGAAGEGTGLVAGKLGGKILEGIGGKIAGKVNPDILGSVANADPYFTNTVDDLTATAQKHNLLDGTPLEGLKKMPGAMKSINQNITGLLGSADNLPASQVLKDYASVIKNTSNFDETVPAYTSQAMQMAHRLQSITQPDGSIDPLDLYNLKSDLAGELSRVFNKQAHGDFNMSPKEDMKMSLWNSIKNTLDTVSPEVRQLNGEQNDIYNIAKAFVKHTGKGQGESTPNQFFDILSGALGNAVGGPLGAVGAVGLRHLGGLPVAGKAMMGAGKALPAIGGAVGAAAGSGLGSLVVGHSDEKNNEENNNSQQNNASSLPSIPQSNPNLQQVTSSNTNRDSATGNYSLPAANSVNTNIPQAYPTQNYLGDIAKIGNNPIALERANAAYNASQEQARQYAATHGLDPDGIQFMQQSAPQLNDMMNQLRGMIKQNGTGPLNDIPAVKYIKSQTNPQYAQMLSLMTQLKALAAHTLVGGRLSNFDIQKLTTMPTADDTTSSALAKLDQSQQTLVNQYSRLLPLYSMSLYAQMPASQTTINGTGNTLPPIGAGAGGDNSQSMPNIGQ